VRAHCLDCSLEHNLRGGLAFAALAVVHIELQIALPQRYVRRVIPQRPFKDFLCFLHFVALHNTFVVFRVNQLLTAFAN
jgi:hypothetical protein